MASADSQRERTRETLAAVRARLELVAAADPAGMTSPLTVRESLAFVRLLHRNGFASFGGGRTSPQPDAEAAMPNGRQRRSAGRASDLRSGFREYCVPWRHVLRGLFDLPLGHTAWAGDAAPRNCLVGQDENSCWRLDDDLAQAAADAGREGLGAGDGADEPRAREGATA